MSKLRLSGGGTGQVWDLNVLSFSAPLVASISTVQTRPYYQHFPVKANQPEISMSVLFSSERDFEHFQAFVRRSQVNAQRAVQVVLQSQLVKLNWPQRNINNWTGVISSFVAGGARRNYAPHAKIEVVLVESAIAKYTDIATSFIPSWQAIVGLGSPFGVMGVPSFVNDLFSPTGPLFSLLTTNNLSAGNIASILSGGLGIPGGL